MNNSTKFQAFLAKSNAEIPARSERVHSDCAPGRSRRKTLQRLPARAGPGLAARGAVSPQSERCISETAGHIFHVKCSMERQKNGP